MLYIDNFHQFSTKISHDENGDKSFSLIFDTAPSSQEKIGIFCVMDGVSSTDGAAQSSALASKEIRANLASVISDIDILVKMDESEKMQYFFSVMRKAILSADKLLWNAPAYFACTVSIAIVFGDWVYTANVGDSPIYLYDSFTEELNEIYTCQNEAGYKVRRGEITKEEALTDRSRNHLLKSVGGKAMITDTDVSTMKQLLPQEGILMLGSDGALGVFNEEKLGEVVAGNRVNMKKLCNAIYEQVVEEKGKDDTTLIAARICVGF